MFDTYGKDLLRTGIIEAKAKHKDVARRYLDRAIYSLSGLPCPRAVAMAVTKSFSSAGAREKPTA